MTAQADRELEVRLAAWLATRSPDEVPAALVARAAAIPRSSPVRRRLRLPIPIRVTRPGAALAAIATAVLVVVTGALLFGRTPKQIGPVASPPVVSPPPASDGPTPSPASSTPSPSRTPSLSVPFRSGGLLPAAIPESLPNGVVDTPLGRVRWVHLQGDSGTLPDPLVPTQSADGSLVWFSSGGPTDICFNGGDARPECVDPPGPRLAVSDDLIGTRVVRTLPLADGSATLLPVGDAHWLLANDGTGAWWSANLTDWHPTDVTAVRSPGPTSIDWRMHPAWVVKAGGATLGQFSFEAVDPGALLGYPGRPVQLRKDDAGEYVAREFHSMRDGGDVDLGPVNVIVSAAGVRFTDQAGRETGRVDGADQALVDRWVRFGLHEDVIARLDGDRWVPVELPGPALGSDVALIDARNEILVFGTDPNGSVREWRSKDGRTWIGGDALRDTNGAPLHGGSGVWYRDEKDGTRTIIVGRFDGGQPWSSTDGRSWTVDSVVVEPPTPVRIPGGWVRTGDQTDDGSWEVSRDGSTWLEAPALAGVVDKIAPSGAGGSSESAIEDVVFFSVDEMGGPRDLWLLEFELP